MKIDRSAKTISTSDMRDIVTVKSVIDTQDGEGGYTTTLTTVKDIFAKVELKEGSRVLEAAQITFSKPFKIYCRYDAAITKNSVLVYSGLELTIHSINNISGLNRYFEILAYTDV